MSLATNLQSRFKGLQDARRAELKRAILNLLEKGKYSRLLDLGCSNGDFTVELGNRINTPLLYGIEIVEESVNQARQQGINVYRSDLNTPFPFGDESIDVVHAKEMLEHLHHTGLFLKEIYRVLVHWGYTIITVPNLAAWHNIFCLLWGWQPFPTNMSDEIVLGNPLSYNYKINPANGSFPLHFRIPTYRALKELLEYHSFKVERMIGVGYYPFWGAASRPMAYLDPRHSAYLVIKGRKQ